MEIKSMDVFKRKLAQIPTEPGVYLYKNSAGNIIYVGKAKSLRNRVRSYFQQSRNGDCKLDHLRAEIRDVEFIVVDSEMEALALENNLIKQHKPKFNILLRDDKTFPYLKLTAHEEFPRVLITRKVHKDSALYFGPYIRASLATQTYKLIGRYFQLRTCSIPINGRRPRPCLDYHLHRCLAPCVDSLCSQETYQSRVRDLKLFMEGKRGDLVKRLSAKMQDAADEENYELAAHYRDMLRTIEQLAEPQKISSNQALDVDIFALCQEDAKAAVQIFHLRNGRVVDRREFFWENLETGTRADELLASVMKQYYFLSEFTPDEIHVSYSFEDRELLASFLSGRKGRRVEIKVPQRGLKKDFIEMVEKNARLAFQQRFRLHAPSGKAIVEELANLLNLETPPARIECFDISHIQGSDSVASMVVWQEGRMQKGEYRKFIIKTVQGIDDYKSLHEVVQRRYKRLLDEHKPLPGLILIDGGLGQLHAAARALEELDMPTHPLASIAKKEEIIYVRGNESEPVILPKNSPALHLVQQIRDETHRFALTFHRARRGKRTLTSELHAIPGVGDKTCKRLLQEFGSVRTIREASLERLASILGPSLAKHIYIFFHPL
jgi:excinuclease ABC subunit C